MPEQRAFERSVECTRSQPDRLARILVLDDRHGVLETQHMRAVGLAPARRGNHRRARIHRDDRQAAECPGRLPEKIRDHALPRRRVLVVDEDHDPLLREQIEDGIERTALRDGAEPGATESPRHIRIQRRGLQRAADEMEQPLELRELPDARDGRDLPISEVPREQQHPFPCA